MFVTIIRLRTRGRRLPKAALERADRHRGHLAMEDGRATLHLDEDSRAPVLGPLYDAQVTKIRRGSFLIAGTERFGVVMEEHRQTWWCRVEY